MSLINQTPPSFLQNNNLFQKSKNGKNSKGDLGYFAYEGDHDYSGVVFQCPKQISRSGVSKFRKFGMDSVQRSFWKPLFEARNPEIYLLSSRVSLQFLKYMAWNPNLCS